ncbi:DUF6364 family protein [Ekhidna sp.]|uniref:DUF6364 family protein n=1 Tax=Ekhidna sp. TaxID=2608089 RepID=UPI003CCB872D
MDAKSKKTKLTLTIRKDLIEKAKSSAKAKGISVSKLFEEAFEKEDPENLKEQKAASRLLEHLEKSKPVETLPESDKELWHKHLDEKYG